MEFSRYRISTITGIGNIGPTDLDQFFMQISLHDPSEECMPPASGIAYAGHGTQPGTVVERTRGILPSMSGKSMVATTEEGVQRRRQRRPKKGTQPKVFNNNLVLIVWVQTKDDGINHVNAKVFGNGTVQLTGARSIDVGRRAMQRIALEHYQIFGQGGAFVDDDDEAHCYHVKMINTDFKTNVGIKLDALYYILTQEYPNAMCFYDPCIHQRLQFSYCFNKTWKPGGPKVFSPSCMCDATPHCSCRKVTIFVFASGSVVITGAVDLEQQDEVYEFVTQTMSAHESIISRAKVVALPTVEKSRPIHEYFTIQSKS